MPSSLALMHDEQTLSSRSCPQDMSFTIAQNNITTKIIQDIGILCFFYLSENAHFKKYLIIGAL